MLFCNLLLFSRSSFLPQSTHFSWYGEQNSCSQSSYFSGCKYYVQQSMSFVSQSSDVSWLWISVFIDVFFWILWAFRPELFWLLTLLISLFFDFISSLLLSLFLNIISFFSDKKESFVFEFNIFSGFSVLDWGGSNFFNGSFRRQFSALSI